MSKNTLSSSSIHRNKYMNYDCRHNSKRIKGCKSVLDTPKLSIRGERRDEQARLPIKCDDGLNILRQNDCRQNIPKSNQCKDNLLSSTIRNSPEGSFLPNPEDYEHIGREVLNKDYGSTEDTHIIECEVNDDSYARTPHEYADGSLTRSIKSSSDLEQCDPKNPEDAHLVAQNAKNKVNTVEMHSQTIGHDEYHYYTKSHIDREHQVLENEKVEWNSNRQQIINEPQHNPSECAETFIQNVFYLGVLYGSRLEVQIRNVKAAQYSHDISNNRSSQILDTIINPWLEVPSVYRGCKAISPAANDDIKQLSTNSARTRVTRCSCCSVCICKDVMRGTDSRPMVTPMFEKDVVVKTGAGPFNVYAHQSADAAYVYRAKTFKTLCRQGEIHFVPFTIILKCDKATTGSMTCWRPYSPNLKVWSVSECSFMNPNARQQCGTDFGANKTEIYKRNTSYTHTTTTLVTPNIALMDKCKAESIYTYFQPQHHADTFMVLYQGGEARMFPPDLVCSCDECFTAESNICGLPGNATSSYLSNYVPSTITPCRLTRKQYCPEFSTEGNNIIQSKSRENSTQLSQHYLPTEPAITSIQVTHFAKEDALLLRLASHMMNTNTPCDIWLVECPKDTTEAKQFHELPLPSKCVPVDDVRMEYPEKPLMVPGNHPSSAKFAFCYSMSKSYKSTVCSNNAYKTWGNTVKTWGTKYFISDSCVNESTLTRALMDTKMNSSYIGQDNTDFIETRCAKVRSDDVDLGIENSTLNQGNNTLLEQNDSTISVASSHGLFSSSDSRMSVESFISTQVTQYYTRNRTNSCKSMSFLMGDNKEGFRSPNSFNGYTGAESELTFMLQAGRFTVEYLCSLGIRNYNLSLHTTFVNYTEGNKEDHVSVLPKYNSIRSDPCELQHQQTHLAQHRQLTGLELQTSHMENYSRQIHVKSQILSTSTRQMQQFKLSYFNQMVNIETLNDSGFCDGNSVNVMRSHHSISVKPIRKFCFQFQSVTKEKCKRYCLKPEILPDNQHKIVEQLQVYNTREQAEPKDNNARNDQSGSNKERSPSRNNNAEGGDNGAGDGSDQRDGREDEADDQGSSGRDDGDRNNGDGNERNMNILNARSRVNICTISSTLGLPKAVTGCADIQCELCRSTGPIDGNNTNGYHSTRRLCETQYTSRSISQNTELPNQEGTASQNIDDARNIEQGNIIPAVTANLEPVLDYLPQETSTQNHQWHNVITNEELHVICRTEGHQKQNHDQMNASVVKEIGTSNEDKTPEAAEPDKDVHNQELQDSNYQNQQTHTYNGARPKIPNRPVPPKGHPKRHGSERTAIGSNRRLYSTQHGGLDLVSRHTPSQSGYRKPRVEPYRECRQSGRGDGHNEHGQSGRVDGHHERRQGDRGDEQHERRQCARRDEHHGRLQSGTGDENHGRRQSDRGDGHHERRQSARSDGPNERRQSGKGDGRYERWQVGRGDQQHERRQSGSVDEYHERQQSGRGDQHYERRQSGRGDEHHERQQSGRGDGHERRQNGRGNKHHERRPSGRGGEHHERRQGGRGDEHHERWHSSRGDEYHERRQSGRGDEHHEPRQSASGDGHHELPQKDKGDEHHGRRQNGRGDEHHELRQKNRGEEHYERQQSGRGAEHHEHRKSARGDGHHERRQNGSDENQESRQTGRGDEHERRQSARNDEHYIRRQSGNGDENHRRRQSGRGDGQHERRQSGRGDGHPERRQGRRGDQQHERRQSGRGDEHHERRESCRGDGHERHRNGRGSEHHERRPSGRGDEHHERRQGGRGDEHHERRQRSRDDEQHERRQSGRGDEHHELPQSARGGQHHERRQSGRGDEHHELRRRSNREEHHEHRQSGRDDEQHERRQSARVDEHHGRWLSAMGDRHERRQRSRGDEHHVLPKSGSGDEHCERSQRSRDDERRLTHADEEHYQQTSNCHGTHRKVRNSCVASNGFPQGSNKKGDDTDNNHCVYSTEYGDLAAVSHSTTSQRGRPRYKVKPCATGRLQSTSPRGDRERSGQNNLAGGRFRGAAANGVEDKCRNRSGYSTVDRRKDISTQVKDSEKVYANSRIAGTEPKKADVPKSRNNGNGDTSGPGAVQTEMTLDNDRPMCQTSSEFDMNLAAARDSPGNCVIELRFDRIRSTEKDMWYRYCNTPNQANARSVDGRYTDQDGGGEHGRVVRCDQRQLDDEQRLTHDEGDNCLTGVSVGRNANSTRKSETRETWAGTKLHAHTHSGRGNLEDVYTEDIPFTATTKGHQHNKRKKKIKHQTVAREPFHDQASDHIPRQEPPRDRRPQKPDEIDKEKVYPKTKCKKKVNLTNRPIGVDAIQVQESSRIHIPSENTRHNAARRNHNGEQRQEGQSIAGATGPRRNCDENGLDTDERVTENRDKLDQISDIDSSLLRDKSLSEALVDGSLTPNSTSTIKNTDDLNPVRNIVALSYERGYRSSNKDKKPGGQTSSEFNRNHAAALRAPENYDINIRFDREKNTGQWYRNCYKRNMPDTSDQSSTTMNVTCQRVSALDQLETLAEENIEHIVDHNVGPQLEAIENPQGLNITVERNEECDTPSCDSSQQCLLDHINSDDAKSTDSATNQATQNDDSSNDMANVVLRYDRKDGVCYMKHSTM